MMHWSGAVEPAIYVYGNGSRLLEGQTSSNIAIILSTGSNEQEQWSKWSEASRTRRGLHHLATKFPK